MNLTERSPEQYLQWARWLLALILLIPLGQSFSEAASIAGNGWLRLWLAVLAVQLIAYSPWPGAGRRRLTLHLLLDILLWNLLVWLTGGASNPFAALLLTPLVLAFLLLPPLNALLLLGVSILSQLLQLEAVPELHHGHGGMNAHFEAMAFGFVIAAVLLAVTLLYLRRQLHQRDLDLQRLREAQLRDEQLLAVGTAAAQLTHEMATPVQSVSLLLDELEQGQDSESQRATEPERRVIRQQLQRMQDLLADWRLIAEDVRTGRLRAISAATLIKSVRELLTITRPNESIEWRGLDALGCIQVNADRTLIPAILSLLDNALEAGGAVQVQCHVQGSTWCMDIDHDGRPLSIEQRARLGAQCLPSEQGFGVGALVSNATLERFGGRVYWSGDDRTTRTRLEMPVQEIER